MVREGTVGAMSGSDQQPGPEIAQEDEPNLDRLIEAIRAHPDRKVCLDCLKPRADAADDARHDQEYDGSADCPETSCWCRGLCWEDLYDLSCAGVRPAEELESLLREAIARL